MSKQPPPAPTASAVGPCPTSIQISRTSQPAPSHHPTTPLEEHDGKVSIGGRNITNLRFAEQELETLGESLHKTFRRYKMEISAEKAKLMTNSANGIQRETKVKGHSSTMEQLFQMMAPNQGFYQGLPKALQLLQR